MIAGNFGLISAFDKLLCRPLPVRRTKILEIVVLIGALLNYSAFCVLVRLQKSPGMKHNYIKDDRYSYVTALPFFD